MTVAVGLVVVVGVTRVYLRVHYLTDVLGGAALGVAIWSLVGMLALFAGRVRHNGAQIDERRLEDRVSLIVIGVATAISLARWIALIAVPAWRSYWRAARAGGGARA